MMDSRVNYEFRKIVKELAKLRGQGTELITIYIPPGYQISEIVSKLREEAGQAMNIKSKQTRKNVTAAIERLLNALKAYKKPPEHGLVLFAGNIDDKIELFKLEPPEPVPIQTYRCDSTFFLAPLLEMLEPKEMYGLLTIDRREATIALLKGKRVEIVRSMCSQVPGKHRAGGQCVHENSLIQLADGTITEIKNIKQGDAILSQSKYTTKTIRCSHVFSSKRSDAYTIKTRDPALEITVTPEHWFFVPDSYGIGLKYAEDLEVGDHVLVVKHASVEGKETQLRANIPNVEYPTKRGIKYLVEKRKEKGLSQKEVAKRVGITRSAISQFERGGRRISHDKIMQLLALYDIDKEVFSQRFMKKVPAFRFPKRITPKLAQLLGYILGKGCRQEHRIQIYDSDISLLRTYKRAFECLFGVSVYLNRHKRRGCYTLTYSGKELVETMESLFAGVFLPPHEAVIPKRIMNAPNKEVAAFIKGVCDAQAHVKHNGVYLLTASEKFVKQLQVLLLRFGIVASVSKGSKECEIEICDPESLMNFKKYIGFSSKRKVKKLKNFKIAVSRGDVIQAEIKQIIKERFDAVFYDLTVPETECFVANNFVLHNSAVRFERLIEIAAHEWFKKVGELANKTFSDEKVKGVIIGGPGPTKNSFLNADYLNAKVKQKIVGTIDTSYTDEFGIREMMQKAGEIMRDLDIIKEKQLINRFLKESSTHGLATYGEKEVRQSLLEGKVETLLLSEDLDWRRVMLKCPHCGFEKEKSVKGGIKPEKCDKCGVSMNVVEEKDIVEELSELAESVGTKVEIISTDTPEGEQFFKGFGGIGAILRFK